MDDVDAPQVDVRLWGKERGLPYPYPVICHLLDTAAVFGALEDALLDGGARRRIAAELGLDAEAARPVLSLWAGLHDLGKITPPFQAQVPSAFKPVAGDASYVAAAGAEGLRGFRHELPTHWSCPLRSRRGVPELADFSETTVWSARLQQRCPDVRPPQRFHLRARSVHAEVFQLSRRTTTSPFSVPGL
ncbi:CRISPR-associated endonuclease Cas3'' [Streptomyces sp. NPDC051572]|uniref:CRISPR-associated endonuclease Cas3'' n=1 Tax=Streptomyces sp. NPDC051572 TaxID=3155802 RepID=UPI00344FF28C